MRTGTNRRRKKEGQGEKETKKERYMNAKI